VNKPVMHLPRRRRFAGMLALGTAAIVATAMAALPAQAAATHGGTTSASAARHTTAKPDTVTVHLHGRTFHVQVNGRFGVVSQRGRHLAVNQPANGTNRPAVAQGNLNYGGGPVATNPVIYLDFWGSQWDSDSNGVEQYMQQFFSGIGDSSDNWSPIMNQYPDGNGNAPTFSGGVLAGTWVDDSAPAPANAAQSDIAAEAQNAASHFGVSGDNADIFVMSPSGTSPDGFPNSGFCAWHDYNGTTPYTNMPYVLDAGSSCGANSVQQQLDGFSIVGGHEYAEAVTDPEPSSGWVASDGEEIGDLCAWQNLAVTNLDTGSFATQPLWSNNDGGCTQTAP
jgi:hypothetical protein